MNLEANVIKIAVTGPHCSGKTTLLSRIEPELCNFNVKFVKFDGSDCPINYSEKSTINHEKSEINITMWMLSKLLSREIEVEYDEKFKNNLIIFDRCLLDQIVYPMVILKEHPFVNELSKIIGSWLSSNPYNLVFYVPKNEEFLKKVPDFNQDLEYLQNVENAYLKVLSKLNKKFENVVILPKNQDKQKEIIVSKIKSIIN